MRTLPSPSAATIRHYAWMVRVGRIPSSRPSSITRFLAYVERGEGCWVWTGRRSRDGYGNFSLYGEGQVKAHRFAYRAWRGPIPEGLTIDHLCRNKGCVNPSHLEVVTLRENILRGENPAAQNARKTHCKRGHLFDEENTCRWRNSRICRTCKRQKQAAA